MRYTAVFTGTQGPGGSVCPETARLYYLFDVADNVAPRDKAVSNAVQHIMDGLSGEPQLVKVMEGGFMPRSNYEDPMGQQKREAKAKLVPLYVYTLPGRE